MYTILIKNDFHHYYEFHLGCFRFRCQANYFVIEPYSSFYFHFLIVFAPISNNRRLNGYSSSIHLPSFNRMNKVQSWFQIFEQHHLDLRQFLES